MEEEESYTFIKIAKVFDNMNINDTNKFGLIKALVERRPEMGMALGEYLKMNHQYPAALGALLCNYFYQPSEACLQLLDLVICKILDYHDRITLRVYWPYIIKLPDNFIISLRERDYYYRLNMDMVHLEVMICAFTNEINVLREDIADLRQQYISSIKN